MPNSHNFDNGNLMPITTERGELVHKKHARPEGTRKLLRDAIDALHDLANISMPGDFHVKARNLIVDMENEKYRREP